MIDKKIQIDLETMTLSVYLSEVKDRTMLMTIFGLVPLPKDLTTMGNIQEVNEIDGFIIRDLNFNIDNKYPFYSLTYNYRTLQVNLIVRRTSCNGWCRELVICGKTYGLGNVSDKGIRMLMRALRYAEDDGVLPVGVEGDTLNNETAMQFVYKLTNGLGYGCYDCYRDSNGNISTVYGPVGTQINDLAVANVLPNLEIYDLVVGKNSYTVYYKANEHKLNINLLPSSLDNGSYGRHLSINGNYYNLKNLSRPMMHYLSLIIKLASDRDIIPLVFFDTITLDKYSLYNLMETVASYDAEGINNESI